MKFIAAILSLHFLLLISAGTLSGFNNNTNKHACCKVKSEQQQSKDCGEKGCNPFASCCSMMGFIPQTASLTFKKQKFSKDKFALHAEAIDSNFNSGAWHPPKV